MPRIYSSRLSFSGTVMPRTALRGVMPAARPSMASMAARTKISVHTPDDTGLPGNPRNGIKPDAISIWPKIIGLPGRMAMRQKLSVSLFFILAETRSCRPTDAPPVRISKSASVMPDSATSSASFWSAIGGRVMACPPISVIMLAIMTVLLDMICAGCSSSTGCCPGSINSLPVEPITITGFLRVINV